MSNRQTPTRQLEVAIRFRANSEQIRQSRPDSGVGLGHFSDKSIQKQSSFSLLAVQSTPPRCAVHATRIDPTLENRGAYTSGYFRCGANSGPGFRVKFVKTFELFPLRSAAVYRTILLHRNVRRFRGGLVFKAHRLFYHSTLVLAVIKKKKKKYTGPSAANQVDLPPSLAPSREWWWLPPNLPPESASVCLCVLVCLLVGCSVGFCLFACL